MAGGEREREHQRRRALVAQEHADIWKAWVTPEAATSIQAALDENEIPDGWPDA